LTQSRSTGPDKVYVVIWRYSCWCCELGCCGMCAAGSCFWILNFSIQNKCEKVKTIGFSFGKNWMIIAVYNAISHIMGD
jgi:hypothetical protein